MKLLDLNAQYKNIKKEIDQAIQKVINDSDFILGQDVTKFEFEIAKFCKTKYAVGLNSGTDALFLALKSYGISKGDEVITTPFSFIATAETVALLGAKLIFADINLQTYNIDPAEIEKKITKKTKAIIPVHLYGQPADMGAIMDIAKKYRLIVIEDAAQSIGAKFKDKPVGSIGHVGCFSFYPAKNLGAYGDAGMITTNDKKIALRIRSLRNHGANKKYVHSELGYSSRLDSIQAAVLRVKLKYLNNWNRIRIRKAKQYNSLLTDSSIVLPYINPKTKSVYQQYTIRVSNREALKNKLNKNNIPAAIHYPLPLHFQLAIKKLKLGYKKGSFPNAEKAAREVISLPLYPELKNSEQKSITETILKFYK